MMNLYVAQKVLCLDDRRRGGGRWEHEALPKTGAVYTVRAIVSCIAEYGLDEDGLPLAEIVNQPRLYSTPRGPVTRELAIRISRFRPVRTTNIELFQKMLEPLSAYESEGAMERV
jgi:hypothetical protein